MIKRVLLIVIAMLVPFVLLGQTVGKIIGTVTDRETGDALPGANVVIEGTLFGGASDVNGYFIILNVPVGSYTVKAAFIGFRNVEYQNVRVSIGLSTELNFGLPSEALAVSEITIIAERPLVNKNATNSISVISAEQMENLPLRGYTNVASIQAGVVNVGGVLHVRGGRAEEVAYYVDGVSQNDPYTFNQSGDIISNSVEEVQVQAGGFNAEYGFANSGMIQVTTKTGGNQYSIAGEIITDEFLSQSDEKLGAFGYGYNTRNGSISGPVPGLSKVNFFAAIEQSDFTDRRRSSGVHPVGLDASGDVLLRGGPLPNNGLERWNWNGNVTINLNPVRFKIGGNSTRDDANQYFATLGNTSGQFQRDYSLFNSQNNPRFTNETDSYYIKATHTLGATSFYTATASFFRSQFKRGDARFWDDDFPNAFDPAFNSAIMVAGNNPRVDDEKARFSPEGTTWTQWERDESTYFALRADLTHQQGRTHEFKVGFESRFHTVRHYRVSQTQLASATVANPDADPAQWYKAAFAENIGYDIFGEKEVNSGIDKARKPLLAAFYLQDKLEFEDLVLNVGLRWDYFKTDAPTFADPTNILFDEEGFIDPAQLQGDKVYSNLNPRLGISMPVSDRTVFHAQYGKFTQPPELDRLFIAYADFANNLTAGNFTESANPELKPVRTTSYEVGFRHQIGDNSAIDITAYYKELRDLVQERNLTALPTSYARFINTDYGTIKGVSATFELRRTQRLAATAQYTLQFAAGTGSASNDARAVNWLGNPPTFPTVIAPLDFDQRHTGAVNLDFRTTANDGPIWGRAGLNMLLSFHSGRPYTPGNNRSQVFDTGSTNNNFPVAQINSEAMPFFMQLDAKLDKSFAIGGVDLNVYLWAVNLLGRSNVRIVYAQSGVADTDGWLTSNAGKAQISSSPASFESLYNARTDNALHYEQPRQYRLGLRFNFK